MDIVIESMDAEQVGVLLAKAHSHTLSDFRNGSVLNGKYLQTKSRKFNMPFYNEIFDCLEKTDEIIEQITAEISDPFVKLQNWHTENSEQNVHGNPTWDIGFILTLVNDSAEVFLREYLKHGGIHITIIELYIGILYTKLNRAIVSGDVNKWEQLAMNECLCIANGHMVTFGEISAGALSSIGLPGLSRL
ncbi:MAG: hypothetical protein FWC91_10285 [Defluviitaleaceae bacterium]|nr:hypothetical protein [Defluviitaleaceae bacterium]